MYLNQFLYNYTMKKFDELKYWFGLNEPIKTTLALSGLAIAIVGLMSFFSPTSKIIAKIVLIFLILSIIMQLILGARDMGIAHKKRKDYKAKYQKQLNNLKPKNRKRKQNIL